MPTTWKINAINPNNTVHYLYWEKGPNRIVCKNTYNTALLLCNSDIKPLIDTDNPNGIEITWQEQDWRMKTELDELDDYENYDDTLSDFYQPLSREWDWDTLTDPAAQAAIAMLWPTPPQPGRGEVESAAWEAMEANGWANTESAIWLFGPLLLEQAEDRVVPNDYDDPSYYLDDSEETDTTEGSDEPDEYNNLPNQ